MAFVNEWFTFDSVIDKETCNKILSIVNDDWEDAEIDRAKGFSKEERLHGRKSDYKVVPGSRVSEVFWTDAQWIYDLIWPFMIRANNDAGWRYDIVASESSQITRYKKGGFYNFHIDGLGDNLSSYDFPDRPFMNERVRKLSMSVILNDDFDGGETIFPQYNYQTIVSTGSVLVFPVTWSYLHRGKPLTNGYAKYMLGCFLQYDDKQDMDRIGYKTMGLDKNGFG